MTTLYWIAHSVVDRPAGTEVVVSVLPKQPDLTADYPEAVHLVQGAIDVSESIGDRIYVLPIPAKRKDIDALKNAGKGKTTDCPTIEETEDKLKVKIQWAKELRSKVAELYEAEISESKVAVADVCSGCGRVK